MTKKMSNSYLGKLVEKLWKRYNSKLVFLSFLIIGFCNSAPFAVMLTAAHDLLKDPSKIRHHEFTNNTNNLTISRYDCNKESTGTILLVDFLSIFIRLVSAFYAHRLKYWNRAFLVVGLGASSFLIVSFSHLQWLTFIGVIFACLSTSFGEVTYLSLSSLYPTKSSFAAWASGTGASGFVSTFLYAGLTSLGVSTSNAFLFMLIMPGLMTFGFLALPAIDYVKTDIEKGDDDDEKDDIGISIIEKNICLSESKNSKFEALKFMDKLDLIIDLKRFMIPMFLVYFCEYFINQGIFELLYFRDDKTLTEHSLQYRWYNVMFRFAAFLARSSINCFQIREVRLFALLQALNLVFLVLQVFYGFIPSIWIVFVIILWEGLIAGACYSNVFNLISTEISKEYREFSMSIATIAEAFGIALAGLLAIPTHTFFCKMDAEF